MLSVLSERVHHLQYDALPFGPPFYKVTMTPSLLAKSAQGASFLVLLQVASRALTFIVNQVLLRYISPQILGVATQLELFSVSTLYFSRESTRVALQRRRHDAPNPGTQSKKNVKSPQDGKAAGSESLQQAINLSYLSIALGILLTLVFQSLYKRSATPEILSTPYFLTSLHLSALATVLELLHEPFFATASHQLSYSIRTSAEMAATFTRCVVTCSTAIYAVQHDLPIGVLPFAIGQLSYSILLLLGYSIRLLPLYTATQTSHFPRRPSPSSEWVSTPLLKLSGLLYAQSLFKQLLTSGDAYLVATLTSLSSQGAYALASNYGGLLARVLFQPIEEASRTLFARLLPPLPSPSLPSSTTHPFKTAQDKNSLHQALHYLRTLLRLYALLSLILTMLAPPLTTPLLTLLAGPRWTATGAPTVLSAYCYYIPLLAINGLLEAYVSAVATPSQLRSQSIFMVACSAVFALVGYLVLGLGEGGASGLVVVNAVVALGRGVWSRSFVARDLRARGVTLGWSWVPRWGTVAVAGAGRGLLNALMDGEMGGSGWVQVGGVVAGSGVGMLLCERAFLWDCWWMTRGGWRGGEVGLR